MKVGSIVDALMPWYGSEERFRFYLRLREYFRKHSMYFFRAMPKKPCAV